MAGASAGGGAVYSVRFVVRSDRIACRARALSKNQPLARDVTRECVSMVVDVRQ